MEDKYDDIYFSTLVSDEMIPQIHRLIIDSFHEYIEMGMNFTCSSYTQEDVKQKVLKDFVVIAVRNKNEVVGITSFSPINEKGCYENISAVSSKVKGNGVGTLLCKKRKEIMLKNGFDYLLSDTAVNAKRSVVWHKKKCGCSVIGFKSFESTNYFSYVFREDLVPVNCFQKYVKYPLIFLKSYLVTHILFDARGNKHKFWKIVKR